MMTDQERLKEINRLLDSYYSTDDSFEHTDLAIKIIQGHVSWLIKRAESVQKYKGAVESIDNFVKSTKFELLEGEE